ALIYLNTRSIIHRDVKGRNILLNKEGECKLADFGVSKNLQTTQGPGGGEQIAGSPLWLSPEAVSGLKVGPKTDIWSLGITAIEIAENRVPNEECGVSGNPMPLIDAGLCAQSTLRVMRAITANPPPRLNDKLGWSDDFKASLFSPLCQNKLPVR